MATMGVVESVIVDEMVVVVVVVVVGVGDADVTA